MVGGIGVVLKEKDGERRFVFFVDHAVGTAIIQGLETLPTHRPLTHDLLVKLLTTSGGTVRHVVISEAKEGTFFAKVVLESRGESHEIDSRPSDAVAIAARVKAPIFVEEAVWSATASQDFSKPVPLSVLWPLVQSVPPAQREDPSKPAGGDSP